jgi:hypothetical protein
MSRFDGARQNLVTTVAAHHLERKLVNHLPQSSSRSRLTAGAAGFLNLSQSRERPLT